MHCNVIKKMQLHKLGNQIVVVPNFLIRSSSRPSASRLLIWFCMVDGSHITKETNDDKNNDYVLLQ